MSGCSQLHECSLPGSSVHGDSPGKKTGVGCHAAHSGSSQLRDWTQVSQIAGGLKNPGVGSLSLLQGIFPTRKSNWGLLHCRWILYQLSYQGSPIKANNSIKKQAAELNRYFSREDTEMASIINHQESVN